MLSTKIQTKTHRHIDNGVFFDGRHRTLAKCGLGSRAWRKHKVKQKRVKLKKTKERNTASVREERLRKAARCVASIKAWIVN